MKVVPLIALFSRTAFNRVQLVMIGLVMLLTLYLSGFSQTYSSAGLRVQVFWRVVVFWLWPLFLIDGGFYLKGPVRLFFSPRNRIRELFGAYWISRNLLAIVTAVFFVSILLNLDIVESSSVTLASIYCLGTATCVAISNLALPLGLVLRGRGAVVGFYCIFFLANWCSFKCGAIVSNAISFLVFPAWVVLDWKDHLAQLPSQVEIAQLVTSSLFLGFVSSTMMHRRLR